MKKQILKSIIIAAALFTSFTALAQDQNTYAITPVKNVDQMDMPTIEPVKIAEVMKVQMHYVTINVNSAEQRIEVDYRLPNDAFKPELKVMNANGRVLKTFALNDKKTAKEDFYISDFLSGEYNYAVYINGQKVEKGKFELRD